MYYRERSSEKLTQFPFYGKIGDKIVIPQGRFVSVSVNNQSAADETRSVILPHLDGVPDTEGPALTIKDNHKAGTLTVSSPSLLFRVVIEQRLGENIHVGKRETVEIPKQFVRSILLVPKNVAPGTGGFILRYLSRNDQNIATFRILSCGLDVIEEDAD